MIRLECKSKTAAKYSQPSRVQIQDMSTNPLLIGFIRCKVAIQQIRRNIELVITVCRDLMFTGSDNGYSIQALTIFSLEVHR
jgi:hypothetical protein